MSAPQPTTSAATGRPAAGPEPATRPMRLVTDAPTRAFHWLFALSFAGAWITADSERWRGVHVTLGYAFGALLLFRLIYGLAGPRQARLAPLWQRVAGWADWGRHAIAGRLDLSRAANLSMGTALLLLLGMAAPLVLSGYAGYVEWLGAEEVMEELHEFFANALLMLVMAHLALVLLLSVLRRRNLAMPMVTGRVPGAGPDVVKANRRGLALLVWAACLGFIGWQMAQGPLGGIPAVQSERHGGHHEDED